MARSDFYTLLSLDRYARIMGIDPVRFNGCSPINLADGSIIFPIYNDTQNIWPQYSWQHVDSISRDQLAREIRTAEEDIARFLNYWPAPVWVSKEMHTYPKYYRGDQYGIGVNNRGQYKTINARYGKFIAAGRRAVTACDEDVAVVYSDPDGDGFDELATITATVDCTTDSCELKVYYVDKSGAQEWEIRDPISKTLAAGTLTVTYNTWQMVDPDVWNAFPTNENDNSGTGIDLTDAGNLITDVDVYYEFTDFTQASAVFYWENLPTTLTVLGAFTGICSSCDGTGCAACELNTQNGCLHFRDVENGVVVPVPANYSDDDSQWNATSWTQCREPDSVKIWYYAGELSERYRRVEVCDPLSDYLADVIAKLATARLERPFMANNNAQALQKDYRRDRALSVLNTDSYFISDEYQSNPFGTRGGEIYAYQRLKHLHNDAPPRVGLGF